MAQSKQQLFGRAWELVITTESQAITISSSAWDPEALRITFEIDMGVRQTPWFAKIEIYNPSIDIFNTVLTQTSKVSLKAGYQTQPYGLIFQGTVYQPLWERTDVTDFKLTLICYAGLAQSVANFASFSGDDGQNQAQFIAKLCAAAHTPIPLGSVNTAALPSGNLPRRRAFFGDPRTYLEGVAAANNMQAWFGFDGNFNMDLLKAKDDAATLNAVNAATALSYGPTTGLIGSAQQTIDGVEFRILLDPRVVIRTGLQVVMLDMTAVRQAPHPRGTRPSILDANGRYIIAHVRFTGDSRGHSWYADITGLTAPSALAQLYQGDDKAKQLDTNAPK